MEFLTGIDAGVGENPPFASWEDYREKRRRAVHPQMQVIGIEGYDTPKLIYEDSILEGHSRTEPVLLPEQALEMLMHLPDMRLISNLIVLDHSNPEEGWFRRASPAARIPAEYDRGRGLILYRPAPVAATLDTLYHEWSGMLWDARARSVPVRYFGRVGLREPASWGALAPRRTVAIRSSGSEAPDENIRRGRSPRELWASLGERLLQADESVKHFAEGNPIRVSILARVLSQTLGAAPPELNIDREPQLALIRFIDRTIRPRAIERLKARQDEASSLICAYLENPDAG